MKENIREYSTINFFRGKKRNNVEMLRLSEARLDFEYRKLFIYENELDLHVYFSRRIIWNRIAIGFLALAFVCLLLPVIAIIFIVLALVFRFFSWVSKKNFEFVFRSYNFALSIVDGVIFDKHGISFR